MPKAAKSPRNKQKLLDQIRADIVSNNVCPDLAQTATNLVMGDGSPDAEILFIGEAPGKNEDLKGLPFVGAAGKFLDEMLQSVNMERSDVYITNIVKYRPPNNRDPLPTEKKAFWPYLIRQIDVIRPKLVVTLGRHSMEYFLPNKKISQVHGQPKRIQILYSSLASERDGSSAQQGDDEKRTESYLNTSKGVSQLPTQLSAESRSRVASFASKQAETSIVVLPLYHPAAALYNGAMRQTLIEDFARLPQIIKLIKESK